MDKHLFRKVLILLNAVFFVHVGAFCPAGKTGPTCNDYNYAYNKPTSIKEDWASHSSHYAVDHNVTSCTLINPPVEDPWWMVDLSKDMFIDGADFYIGTETLSVLVSYTVEVQKDGKTNWHVCLVGSRSPGGFSTLIRVRCNPRLQGRKVRFTAYHQSLNLVLCDVGVYGACVDGSYGNYCENTCGNCNLRNIVCDKTTGRCPFGCDTGWHGTTCDEVCPHGKYGDACSRVCGKCMLNATCNRFDGECPNLGVCEPGYKSPMCQSMCDNGKYGQGCQDCGYCNNGQPCNKINGTCGSNGCDPGYQEEKCDIPCDDGMYGDECFFECGKCDEGTCNTTTGRCNKCAAGYIEDSSNLGSQTMCRTECEEYKWDYNCVNTCGNCGAMNNSVLVSVPCKKSDGSCLTGCMQGWQGVFCTDPCRPGTYGLNCRQFCGKCKDGASCDAISAECPGECDDGYLGKQCFETCQVGFYGYRCQGRCPENCLNNCSHTDGACICKDGWTGDRCSEVCKSNHYGKNCAFVCGNCKAGTTCNQGDGNCPLGCNSEWTGLKCDAKKIIEVYEKSYGDIIGGAIGGAIALGLIIALVVWIVWRYKQDKSIHFRELASSLRRMSIRGSKSLRRSIARLSMRGRRNHDQQNLGKNVEKPAVSNGTRGKQPIRRMYDCVKLQSNLIHYDDFSRIYLQLQEATPDGRTLLYDSFQSFLQQRPHDHSATANGHTDNVYYNAAVEPDDIQINVGSTTPSRIPEFLPLGANLSGFLLVNAPAASEVLWNHLQQRQIETIISVGKEASFSWRPGERITIGHDVVECINVQMHGSHKETKLSVQRVGTRNRRIIKHLECFFWNKQEKLPLIPTLLMFMERFQQINFSQRERIILVNYLNLHDQAILFTLVASSLEILVETRRADVLRTVAIGGKATAKSIRTFEEFKYLHDVIFQYVRAMENRNSSTAI